jgi:Glycosyl hydrolase family 76
MNCLGMNKNIVLSSLYAICISLNLAAQPAPKAHSDVYEKEMNALYKGIQKHFYDPVSGYYKLEADSIQRKDPYTYLWALCALFQAANEMERVQTGTHLLKPILHIIDDYYDPAPPKPGYADYITRPGFRGGERYYDDNQWIGITAMDAFSRVKSEDFLVLGKRIYAFMMTGYDTVLTGGLYWKENKKTSKNTCSNGPGVIVALQLYQVTRNKTYFDTALAIYNWTNQKLQAPSGLYWDNIEIKNQRISRATLSYNTGTMLQSNIYLYECTGDQKYLNRATAIADSSLLFFYGGQTFRDSYWFNAVLLRAYQHLFKYDKDLKYILAFKKCLDYSLKNEKNPEGLFMSKGKVVDLVSQGGMLEILARFAWFEKQNQSGALSGPLHPLYYGFKGNKKVELGSN